MTIEKEGKIPVWRALPPLHNGGLSLTILAAYDPGIAATDSKIDKHGYPNGFDIDFNHEVQIPGTDEKVRGCYDIRQDDRLKGPAMVELRSLIRKKLMESRFLGIEFEVFDPASIPVTITAEELVELRKLKVKQEASAGQ